MSTISDPTPINPERRTNSLKVSVVAGVLIEQQGKVLLVKEFQSKVRGQWNFPGGHVDIGETIEEAAIREAREETGFDIELTKALPILHERAESAVFHPFAAHITGGELKFQENELLDARWFTPAEIRAMTEEIRNVPYILGSLDAVGL